MRIQFLTCLLFANAFALCAEPKLAGQSEVPARAATSSFAKGADIGWLSEMEAAGRKFYNNSGVEEDCLDVLKEKGINSIRLRVWVNPKNGYCGKEDVVAQAIRAKSKGMRIMIDFHYSDYWADPGKQTKPAAWANLNLEELKAAVYNHTYEVLSALKTNGITPEWVQTGNEINSGLLWPTGEIGKGGATNYAQLINSGYDAVKAVNPAIKTVLHISNGYDNNLFRWNLDNLKTNGGKWDITGMSSYPSANGWTNHNNKVLANMVDMVARYGKPIVISEVGLEIDAAPACKEMLADLMAKNASLGTNGLGVFFWEPEAYSWKGYHKVAFDNSGKPSVAMDAFMGNY